jgi:hypothetical protein
MWVKVRDLVVVKEVVSVASVACARVRNPWRRPGGSGRLLLHRDLETSSVIWPRRNIAVRLAIVALVSFAEPRLTEARCSSSFRKRLRSFPALQSP